MELQKITYFFNELFQTLFSIGKVLILSKWFVKLKRQGLEEKDCVILGNGPSLIKDFENNWNFITSHKKMCVNLFAFSKEYEIVKPDYYILAAPEFWLKNTIDLHIIQRNKLAKEITEKTSWPMKLIVPFTARNSVMYEKLFSNNNIQPIFFNSTPIEGFIPIINRLYKNNLGMPRPHNVLIPTIFIAINIGFKNIYLFGADHSWHEDIKVDEMNKVTVNHQHFFEQKEVRMPMYKLDGKEYFLHDVFRKFFYAFRGYFILKSYADYLKVNIYNASSKSYIDAFEKIKLN